MSIRTNPMKAVPLLLKRVKTARRKFMEKGRDESFDGKMEKLTQELKRIENVFMKVKKNQDELVDNLHEIDAHLRKLDKKRLDQDMDAICKRIRDSSYKLLPMDSFDEISSQILHSSHPSSTQPNNQVLVPQPQPQPQPQRINLNRVIPTFEEICLMSLLIFPVDAVIRKRQAIYLWIGLGFIHNRGELMAEEWGEDIIDRLLQLNAIVPYDKCPTVDKFIFNPHIRPQLESFLLRKNSDRLGFYFEMPSPGTSFLLLKQKKVTLGDEVEHNMGVYNISASYLNFEFKWMDKFKHLEVLQLGRWQDSPLHHIEVGSQEFLQYLSTLKDLRYLSLRGISRIFELPPSIARCDRLEILDLKACHNLETLPDDISSMKSLTHLILSECYLLDGMPKGIDKLTQLQVLKGFVLGPSTKTPCTIADLANLKRLRRLSIHIGREALIKDIDFGSLTGMSKLEHLKISWGVSDKSYSDIQITLPSPSRLKKLHLHGFRGQRIPEWLKPSKLPRGLKELNITGGKLSNMNHYEDNNQWGMEIVRLKYLQHLEIDKRNLKMLFPKLRHALVVKATTQPTGQLIYKTNMYTYSFY